MEFGEHNNSHHSPPFWLPSVFTLPPIYGVVKSHIVPAWCSNSRISLPASDVASYDLLTYDSERQIINSPPSFSIHSVNHGGAGINTIVDIFCRENR